MPTPTIYTVSDWHSVGFVDTQQRIAVNLVEHFDTYQGRGSEKEEGYDDNDDDDDDDELQ
jgi:regulator of RNase E activity RraB